MPRARTIPRLRWWIGGLLFASTVINYIDRQTLSVLAPYLKKEFVWTNTDFAWIVIGFRVAYAVGQTIAGRLIDRMGTRRGLSLTVLWYSVSAAITSLGTGLKSLTGFRFLLGLGESANWPGATKTVAEWFPKSERGVAVALFDSGSAIGGAIAPVLVLWLYATFGSWRPAFLITSSLGFVWLIVWRAVYHPPESHPWLSPEERKHILEGREIPSVSSRPARWSELLRSRNTWGIILGRSLTDPVWFLVADWFAIYLVSRGYKLENTLLGFWVPFLAADLGNFFGGGVSSWLIARGWPVVRARKFIVIVCGLSMGTLAFTGAVSNFAVLITLFAIGTFAYAAWSTMALSLPSDLYPSASVATVSGLSGTGAGLGTILSTFLIGRIADRYSFTPIFIAASIVPLIATVLVLALVRPRKE